MAGSESNRIKNIKYVIISPVRNEAQYLGRTAESVVSQTVLPQQWIIVDDASTDGTLPLIEEYEKKHDFITVLRKPDMAQTSGLQKPKDRLTWAAPILAFNYGLRSIRDQGYDYVVKLDGDLSFGPDLFETILRKFAQSPRLGIAGAHLYQLRNGQLEIERVPDDHVRGATKIYRRRCFEQIGGLREIIGWDSIDELRAQMYGWETRSFPDAKAIHHRLTGSVGGILRGRARHGRTSYLLGYNPFFMLARGIFRMSERPFVVGGIAMLWGFFTSYFQGSSVERDTEVAEYMRRQQRQRLARFLRFKRSQGSA